MKTLALLSVLLAGCFGYVLLLPSQSGTPVSSAVYTDVSEETPAKVLARTAFKSIEKSGSGAVTVYQTTAGKRMIQIHMMARKAANLHVYLLPASDTLASHLLCRETAVDLGPVQHNPGSFMCPIPAEVEIKRYVRIAIGEAASGLCLMTGELKMP